MTTTSAASNGSERMLTEFLADLTACGRDPKTVAGYKGDLTHASKRLARRHVHFLGAQGRDIARDILRLVENGSKPATIARLISAERQFFKFCGERGVIRENPMVSIRLPQGRQRSDPARLLSLAELEAISAVWTRLDPLEKRNRLLLECLSTTDIKVSQLAKLLLSQVNLTTGATSIPRRESKRAKRVLKLDFDPSMTRKLRDFVAKERRDIVPDKDHGYLFPSKTGGGITRTAIWYVRKKARNRAGITRPITANDLRRSFLHLTKK